ncbi:hypothetical protein A5646_03525 [Mycobacterium sp. 1245499.0]|uniref:VG15 protein n=1 Tax=Mycobacterium sp. 1245499.0 TaxID=1834074 RepID=UPI0007FBD22E|nr:hypothetical protein [Mycobacterium sp. 1245499.0]OBK92384.1 hypothetical protein A5646_03525 [Mycobacterium sp. 1245499.0]
MTQPQQQQQNPPPLLLAPLIYTGLQLRQAQDAALAPVLKRVRQLFHLQGVPVTPDQRAVMAGYLYRPLQTARTRTYTAATRYLHGQGVIDVPPLREYRVEAVEKMLENTVDRVSVAGDPVDESNRTAPHVVEQTRKSVARAASRHAQQPARETVQETADESGQEVGWARVLTGAYSCHFCAMLASRGPVYRSDKTALYRGGASAGTYHDGCDCIAVLVRKGMPWEGQDSYEALNKLWSDTGGRTSGKRARNAFRRDWDKLVRSGGSGDYISDSMKPPGGAQ